MAAETILILGESGNGKSTSLRNLNPKETFIISTTSKPLPWKGWKKQYTRWDKDSNPTGNWYQTSRSNNIITLMKYVSKQRPEIKTIVIDDLQYMMSFEFIDRRAEKSYDKFNDIGGGLVDVIRTSDILRDDLKVIFTSHSENTGDSMNPHWTLKTIGRMLNEKITPEGLFTYIFYAMAINNGETIEYKMLTNTDGEHVAKTSLGMFDDKLIDNDISKVIEIIDRYSSGE